jgi:GDPmannose 4,6-dehydratase
MKALVYGANGQMGSYMVDLLHGKDYEVYEHTGHFEDVESEGSLLRSILVTEQPEEIYNFAAKMYAPDSWKDPMEYFKVNGTMVLKMLDVISEFRPKTKFFLAGSAEVFEKESVMQWEDTNRLPDSPYGLAKMVAMDAVRIYRGEKKLFACTGIFFNAESPRRKKTFFSQKVAQEVVRLKEDWEGPEAGYQPIVLGRLDARRDWGWAPEYVEVAWKMMQQDTPDDFVIGTGEAHTCREFVYEALEAAGLPDVEKNFDRYIKYDKTFSPVGNCMRAMPDKAKRRLGWQAQYRFKDVVKMLVEAAQESHKALPREESLAGLKQTIS